MGIHNGFWAWTMSPIKYAHEAVRKWDAHLAANNSGRFRLPKRVDNHFNVFYDPELNVSPELEPDEAPCF